MKKHINAIIVVSLIVIGGIIVLSACASVASAQQKSGMEAQVNTAVAATLIQQMVATKVAAQSVALVSEPEAQATEPSVPTPTPLPTKSAQPTAAATAEAAQPAATATPTPTAVPASASGPSITADENTNCRVGPGTGYAIETFFLKGAQSTVEGRDSTKDWWYIVNPDVSSEFCWVWEGSTTVVGDTSTVPVVAAPAKSNTKTSNLYYYGCYGYNPYNCVNYYNNYCQYAACNPNQQWCNPHGWWTCNPNLNCTCKPGYHNVCKKSSCPPVTEVNYKKYCKNYPQCCD